MLVWPWRTLASLPIAFYASEKLRPGVTAFREHRRIRLPIIVLQLQYGAWFVLLLTVVIDFSHLGRKNPAYCPCL